MRLIKTSKEFAFVHWVLFILLGLTFSLMMFVTKGGILSEFLSESTRVILSYLIMTIFVLIVLIYMSVSYYVGNNHPKWLRDQKNEITKSRVVASIIVLISFIFYAFIF